MKNVYIKKIFEALDGKARFVGGCVRDAVKGLPIKDIDIATPYIPEEVTERLKVLKIKVKPTGIRFGTVTAITAEGNFEITTLRKDLRCDGRHVEVAYTDDWEEDAMRRDFTINAMSCSIEGTLYDYHGGMEDLNNHTIRFVGDAIQRCREDYLRILRFFRFYAWYGKPPPDEAAIYACKLLAPQIVGLSGERVQIEMMKLLGAPDPVATLEIMKVNGILGPVLLKEVDPSILSCLVDIESAWGFAPSSRRRLAAMITSGKYSKEDMAALANRWKLSNKDKDYLMLMAFSPYGISAEMDRKQQQKILRQVPLPIFQDMVLLAWARQKGLEQKNGEEKYQEMLAFARSWELPCFPVQGSDMKELGLQQGKILGEALKAAEIWWEEKDYTPSREEILAYIQKRFF